jgi:hypothetical protein
MKTDFKNGEIDFFADVEGMDTSKITDLQILSKAHQAVNPSPFDIFGKLNFIFLLTTFVTTLFLPQFGHSLLRWPTLYAALDRLPDSVIQAIFSFILLGLCATAAVIFLNRDELRVLRQLRFVQLPLLCLIILVAFTFFGIPVLTTATLAWVAGAFIGVFSAFETGYAIKYRAWEKQALAA